MALITPQRVSWFGEPRRHLTRAKPENPKPYRKQGQEEEWEAKLRYETQLRQEEGLTDPVVRPRERQGMTDEEIESFIQGHRWTFAKTMPHIPHEYVVKQKCRDPIEFERLVVHIRRHGYLWKWRTRWGRYLDWEVDGVVHQFWTMGHPIEITKIINRAVKEHD